MFFRAESKQEESIPSAQHWENLQKRVDQFKALDMKATDANDETCYNKLNGAMLGGIKNGLASEGQYLWTVVPLLTESSAASKKVFMEYGNEKIPTPIGPKSLAFIQTVYMAYYLDSQHVKFSFALNVLATQKKKEYREKADLLSAVIKKYKSEHSDFAKEADAIVDKIMAPIGYSVQAPVSSPRLGSKA